MEQRERRGDDGCVEDVNKEAKYTKYNVCATRYDAYLNKEF